MAQTREWTLPPGGELRFEVDAGRAVAVRLLAGTAEVFGAEVPAAATAPLRVPGPAKVALFSYDGARVSLAPADAQSKAAALSGPGGCAVAYASAEGEAAMHALLNVHRALEDARQRAAEAPQAHAPPVVLVLGIGRNTAARVLANYAVRAGRRVALVDADPASGAVVVPGVLAAHVLSRPLSAEDGFWAAAAGDGQPLAYFLGAASHAESPQVAAHYRALLGRLAHAVRGRLAAAPAECDGGAVVVAPGGADAALAAEMARLFGAAAVLVVGDERLHATVDAALSQNGRMRIAGDAPSESGRISVVRVPRSGGHVARDAAFRRALAQWQCARHFYGVAGEYEPFTVVLHWDELAVRRLPAPGDDEQLAPASALPLGATRKVQAASASAGCAASFGAHLVHALLAVPWAPPGPEPPVDVLEASIAGLLHVQCVDDARRTLTVHSTCPAPPAAPGQQHVSAGLRLLPSPCLVLGSLRWDPAAL